MAALPECAEMRLVAFWLLIFKRRMSFHQLRLFRVTQVWVGALISCFAIYQASAAQTTVTRTNFVERWLTNVVEVRMPTNVFVNSYQTNWIEQRRTNLIDLFVTNRISVNALRTNVVQIYRTNWGLAFLTNDIKVQAYRTNFVPVYHTNWRAIHLTNQIAVQGFQTNFVDRYQTNYKTLHFTNWQNVLVMKTNWINVPVTNTVTIDLLTNRVSAAENVPAPAESTGPKPVATSWLPLNGAVLTEDLTFEASTTSKVVNNQLEVQIKVRWTAEPANPLVVQQWRVERSDGAVLTFGQDQVFKRPLPPGKYKVEARARRDSRSPMLAARGTLVVSGRDAIMQQNLTAQR